MIIILDFDDVLFDTARFKEELAVLFEEHKIDFWETYDRVKKLKGVFSLESYLALARKENKGVDMKRLEKNIDGLFRNLNQFIFPDVVDFLKKFKNHDLIILSWGDKDFQRKKIDGVGKEFASFFDEVIASPNKKIQSLSRILKTYKSRPVIFIDDTPCELEEIKSNFKDVILIRMVRGVDNYSLLKQDYQKVVNLKEAEKLIKNY